MVESERTSESWEDSVRVVVGERERVRDSGGPWSQKVKNQQKEIPRWTAGRKWENLSLVIVIRGGERERAKEKIDDKTKINLFFFSLSRIPFAHLFAHCFTVFFSHLSYAFLSLSVFLVPCSASQSACSLVSISWSVALHRIHFSFEPALDIKTIESSSGPIECRY